MSLTLPVVAPLLLICSIALTLVTICLKQTKNKTKNKWKPINKTCHTPIVSPLSECFVILSICCGWNRLSKLFPLVLHTLFKNVYKSHETQFQNPVCSLKNTSGEFHSKLFNSLRLKTWYRLEMRRWHVGKPKLVTLFYFLFL